MKIVIQSINFHPDLIGIGKYTSEMASWLSSKGHAVRVITAPPYYPQWKVSSGYKKYFWSKETWHGIKVWRCPTWVPVKPNGVTRILHLASFALSSFPIMIAQIFWRPNIIFTIEPPLFAAPAALITTRIGRSKAVLHIQDFEVDAAFDLGLLKSVWLKKIIIDIEKFLLKRFDLVCTISRPMVNRVHSKGVLTKNIYLFPNWADIQALRELPLNPDPLNSELEFSYREFLKIPSDAIIAMYSGNMGSKQGLEILGQVAIRFQQVNKSKFPVHFVFCGDGIARENLVKQCEGLTFVHFLELQPMEMLPQFLAAADIHLLPQRSDVADLVMPSKLIGMMASSRPVLACAKVGTELANIVQHCGLVVPPEDPDAFYEALIILITDKDFRQKLGAAGYSFVIKNLNKSDILCSLEAKLKKLFPLEFQFT